MGKFLTYILFTALSLMIVFVPVYMTFSGIFHLGKGLFFSADLAEAGLGLAAWCGGSVLFLLTIYLIGALARIFLDPPTDAEGRPLRS